MRKLSIYLKVVAFLETLTPKANHILIALSGGPDSVALTYLLQEIQQQKWPNLKLHLAHLNHQLRGIESETDEQFVQQLAQQLNIPLTIERQDIAQQQRLAGTNLEATARQSRYQFLQKVAHEISATYIATGHNMNDQAETLLMRLLRGAGPTGLVGIYPILTHKHHKNIETTIIRPLLQTSRSDIEAYLLKQNITSCLDSSNLSLDFTRNKIRLKIIPELMTINPKVVETLSRTTDILREEFADRLTEEQTSVDQPLTVANLTTCSLAERYERLRQAIKQVKGDLKRIAARHLYAVDALLLPGKSGKRVPLPGGLEVIREFNNIVIRRTLSNKPLKVQQVELGRTSIIGQLSLGFESITLASECVKDGWQVSVDLEKVGSTILVRSRQPGDRYLPVGHSTPIKVKDLMMAKHIGVSERNNWPVCTTLTGEIIWLPGLPVSQAFMSDATTAHFAIIWVK